VFEFVTTVILGAATYIALLLWRRPPVLDELSAVLTGSVRPILRPLARLLVHLPAPKTG
jgi:hypothetical protein